MKDLLKTFETAKAADAVDAKSYGKSEPQFQKTVVPLAEARRKVTSPTFGEVTRRKTEDKDTVELLSGTTVIGTATAVYKTKSQRTWTLTIGNTVIENQHTISKALRAFDAEPVKAKVLAGPKKSAKKAKANG